MSQIELARMLGYEMDSATHVGTIARDGFRITVYEHQGINSNGEAYQLLYWQLRSSADETQSGELTEMQSLEAQSLQLKALSTAKYTCGDDGIKKRIKKRIAVDSLCGAVFAMLQADDNVHTHSIEIKKQEASK